MSDTDKCWPKCKQYGASCASETLSFNIWS